MRSHRSGKQRERWSEWSVVVGQNPRVGSAEGHRRVRLAEGHRRVRSRKAGEEFEGEPSV